MFPRAGFLRVVHILGRSQRHVKSRLGSGRRSLMRDSSPRTVPTTIDKGIRYSVSKVGRNFISVTFKSMAIFFDDGMYTLDAVERILIWKFLIGNNMMLKLTNSLSKICKILD